MRIALVQMRSGANPWENLFLVQGLIEEAKRLQCQLICFPENLFYRGPASLRPKEIQLSVSIDGGLSDQSEFSRALKETLSASSMCLSLGSVLEPSPNSERPYNSHFFISLDGRITSYRKLHLFEFLDRQVSYRESDSFMPGQASVSVRASDFKIGLSICFDLRFPELYRHLVFGQGCEVLLVPSAFTKTTGEAHWHTLLRARAIENQCYVLASAQWGSHETEKGRAWCYGHAIAYDPWGECLIEAPAEGDTLQVVELNRSKLKNLRDRMPALKLARWRELE